MTPWGSPTDTGITGWGGFPRHLFNIHHGKGKRHVCAHGPILQRRKLGGGPKTADTLHQTPIQTPTSASRKPSHFPTIAGSPPLPSWR